MNLEKKNTKNCFWLYSILIEDSYPISRDELILQLGKNGIESRSFFFPVHDMPPYITNKRGNMEVSEELKNKGINLPSSVGLKIEKIEKICNVIKSFA